MMHLLILCFFHEKFAFLEKYAYLCCRNLIVLQMGISFDSIWSKAQRLSASERLALSRKLRESVNESDVERQERTASEIDRFFGGWNEDPRTTEEIMQQIRDGRTANTFPQL